MSTAGVLRKRGGEEEWRERISVCKSEDVEERVRERVSAGTDVGDKTAPRLPPVFPLIQMYQHYVSSDGLPWERLG